MHLSYIHVNPQSRVTRVTILTNHIDTYVTVAYDKQSLLGNCNIGAKVVRIYYHVPNKRTLLAITTYSKFLFSEFFCKLTSLCYVVIVPFIPSLLKRMLELKVLKTCID